MGLHSFRYNMDKLAEALGVTKDKLLEAMKQSRRADVVKVWSSEDKGNFSSATVSVSRKRQDGTYDKDFQGYVNLVGAAHEKIKKLGAIPNDGLLIQIVDMDSQRRWDDTKKKENVSFAIFDFEVFNPNNFKKSDSNTQKAATKTKQAPVIEDEADDEMDLPF